LNGAAKGSITRLMTPAAQLKINLKSDTQAHLLGGGLVEQHAGQ
jgi:hypothetical protein